ILEHPELNIRQIDIESNQEIAPLMAAIQANASESILAFRQGQWHVQRIKKLAQVMQEQKRLLIPAHEYRLIKNASGLISDLNLITAESEQDYILGENELLIAPMTVGLNFRDVLNAMNLYPGDPGPLGSDCAGTIKAVGSGVSEYKVGDAVLGLGMGSLASLTRSCVELIAHRPISLSFEQAAAIPIVFMTAYYSLVKQAKLKQAETVLIHAGAGGVGLAAIQIAQYCKATIIVTAGSEEKRTYLKQYGVEYVFDSRSLDYKDQILKLTHNKGVDVVLNSLSGQGFIQATLDCTAKQGRFIEIGKRDIWTPEEVFNVRADINYQIVALDTMSIEKPDVVRDLLHEVIDLFEDKILTPIPITIYPLDQAIAAFEYLQQAKQIGKVVMTLPAVDVLFKKEAAYLITGGLGGVGLEVAKYLSQHKAGNLILTSRSAPDEATEKMIQRLESEYEIKIIMKQADVSDKTQMEQLINVIHQGNYPLKGIFHAAGIIEDAPIDKQTPEQFTKVFSAKAQGAWYLHEITTAKNIELDYFVLFSSIASLMGSSAQTNYAVANSFLDALAYYRRQQGFNGISLNWGAWAEVGMAKALVAEHKRKGMLAFKNEEALQALAYALKQDIAQLGLMNMNWRKLSQQFINLPSWLKNLTEQKQASVLMETLEAAPEEQRPLILKTAISNAVRKVIGIADNRPIDEYMGFFEMGMDSLMALELKNYLQTLIQRPLPNTLVFDYPDCAALYKFFAGTLMTQLFPTFQAEQDTTNREISADEFLHMEDSKIDQFLNETNDD
ncbi:MAG: SDR family NAD(P)-dependent oxidoreductase, partial [Gammaproteobacteria bacterium]